MDCEAIKYNAKTGEYDKCSSPDRKNAEEVEVRGGIASVRVFLCRYHQDAYRAKHSVVRIPVRSDNIGKR